MKGWIEVTDDLGCRQLVNLASGARLYEALRVCGDEIYTKLLYYQSHPNHTYIGGMTYEELKQKIKEAQDD